MDKTIKDELHLVANRLQRTADVMLMEDVSATTAWCWASDMRGMLTNLVEVLDNHIKENGLPED